MITKSDIRRHLLIILMGTAVGGAILSRTLLAFGLTSLVIRNLIVITASYTFFFGLISLWLSYLKEDKNRLRDAASYSSGQKDIEHSSTSTLGNFNMASSMDNEVGSIIDIIVLIIFVIALLAMVGVWIGVEGPSILMDAAFDVSLSAGMIRASRDMAHENWQLGVFKRTIFPFVTILAVSTFIMFIATKSCPNAHRFSEVMHQCWMPPKTIY